MWAALQVGQAISLTFALASAPAGLSIDEAVGKAIERAHELRARTESEAVARAKTDEIQSAWWPRAEVGGTYLARWPVQTLPISLPAQLGLPPIPEVDDVHHVQLSAKLRWLLFDLGRGPRADATEAQLAAEIATTKLSASELAFYVRSTFLLGILARDLKDIARESLRVAREELRTATVKAAVGTGSELAVAQARVRVAQLEAEDQRAEIDLARRRTTLASLLGDEALPPLQGDLEALAAPTPDAPPSPDTQPEVERLAYARAAALNLGVAERRTFFPTVALQAEATLAYPRGFELKLAPIYAFGAVLSWPIFDGFARSAREAQATHQAAALAAMSEATKERLRRGALDLDERSRAADAGLAAARQIATQTEIYLRIARAGLEAGTATNLDVHTAELGLDQARVAIQRAWFEKALIQAERLRLYGQGQQGQGQQVQGRGVQGQRGRTP
ncbi:MAG: TolC family protein [Deltaproteobacteria bacterium]|nr:TolC family protein [Deltaproteobacteria bacterium]